MLDVSVYTGFKIIAGIYLFKVCSKNTESRSENYSKLTIETQEH